MKAPVLFLIFNRPDVTERVFSEIRKVQPPRLYIAADGPRKERPNEKELCSQARKVVEHIDWPCEVFTLFREENLGCKKAVSSGITWFFDNEEEGIILEDDCLPDPTFFPFCEKMLERYRNDTRIVHIGGSNFQDGIVRGTGQYYFSFIYHVWGWASWRRAWKNYDVNMRLWPEAKMTDLIENSYASFRIVRNVRNSFDATFAGRVNTWDYQWTFSNLVQSGMAVIPNVNLVSNIGFSPNATHTVAPTDLANRPLRALNKYDEPRFISVDKEADLYSYNNTFSIKGKIKADLLSIVASFQKKIKNFRS